MRQQRVDHLVIAEAMRRAEKVDFEEGNKIRCRYQDGTETVFKDVKIYWPSLVRAFYQHGLWSRAQARAELKKYGLRLRPDPGEPGPDYDV